MRSDPKNHAAKRATGANGSTRVVLPNRRPAHQRSTIVSAALTSPDADDFVVKTFSAGTAAQQLAGRSGSSAPRSESATGHHRHHHQAPPTDEERELINRQIDCRRRLIVMKSRNAEADDPSARSVIPQEDLQEWLDNLQLRLHRACLTPSPQPSGGERATGRRPSRLSVSFADAASPRTSSAAESESANASARLKLNQRTGPAAAVVAANSPAVHPLITRPRSISVITDQAAAALTDGNYIEQLQVSLQQASVSSLHERLQERRTSSVGPALLDQLTNPKPTNAVRSKTVASPSSPTKARTRKKSSGAGQLPLLPDKFAGGPASAGKRSKSVKAAKSKTGADEQRPTTGADETESLLSLSSSAASSRSLDHLPPRGAANSVNSAGTERSDNRPLTHSSPLPGRSRQFAPRDFFDSRQTVDDIYVAAEHLLLPPARREAAMSEQTQSSVQTETIIKIQRGSPEEEIQVEDFWGAMPDY